MDTRRLGNSDISVSVLALGTWAMGGERHLWGHVDDNESIAAINAAIDAGVTLLDTAPIYGNGRAETVLGRAVHSRRDDVVIATKCGLISAPDGQAPPSRCLTPESIITECEASLRRLGIDCIDLYQCHWPDPDTSERETFSAFERLKAQGKIRAFGVCNYSCEQMLRAAEFAPLVSLQSPVSLLHRRALQDLVPFCRDHEIALLAYSPLAKGLLTGKFKLDSKITGVRQGDAQFLGRRFRRNLALVEKLAEMAAGYNRTAGQFALRWVIQRPGVTAGIMGAKRPSQVMENLGAVDFEISPRDLRDLDLLLEGI